MLVSKLFESEKITIELMDERSDESNYWQSCHDFVIDNWDEQVESLSEKQSTWLDKILDDMVEWRITKRK